MLPILQLLVLTQLLAINVAVVATSHSRSEFSLCNTTCQQTWTRQTEYRYNTASGRNMSICECGGSLAGESHFAGSCSSSRISNGPVVAINIKYCMTFDEERNVTHVGKCPYNNLPFHFNSDMVNVPKDALQLNHFMCNTTSLLKHHYICGQQRRHGLLCSNCEDGLGPAVMSYARPCVECNNKWYSWLLYLTLSIVPATVLCLLIILLRINVLSPPLNAIVLLCQVITSYVNYAPCRFLYYAYIHRVSALVVTVLTLYGFLNMDFFVYVNPPFCISNSMSTLTVIALDYVVALYPLALAALIYALIESHDSGCMLLVWVWRPFHTCLVRFRRSWDVKGSIINAFATLYVMSFTKVISTSASLLLPTGIQNVCGLFDHRISLYYNASCSMFEQCHLPHTLATIVITSVVILYPYLFITFYPCKFCSKPTCFKRCCKSNLLLIPQEIAKVFFHSFKDGTDGSRDCRWFAGTYLIIKMVIAMSYDSESAPHQIQIVASVIALILVALFQPHTCTLYNCMDSLLFGGLAVIFVLLPASQSNHIGQVILFFIPALAVIILACWKIMKQIRKFSGRCKHLRKCIKQRLLTGTKCNSLVLCCDNGSREEQESLLSEVADEPVLCTIVGI